MRIRRGANDGASAEEQALERKVDAMMSTEPLSPDSAAAQADKAAAKSLTETPPAIDIFKDLKTAPPLAEVKAASEPNPSQSGPVPAGKAVPAPTDANASTDKATDTPVPPKAPTVDDPNTDKAVDDIVAKESDELLDKQDATNSRPQPGKVVVSKTAFKDRLINLFKNKWTWIGLAVIIVALLGVPFTRYKLLGLVIQRPLSVTVIDSKTNTPVSAASLTIDGHQAKTDANGNAKLQAPVGPATLTITKQYYQTTNQAVFVGLKSGATVSAKLVATGRQVPIKILNSITGKPLAGVEISVLNTSAKTDTNGMATIVLPTRQSSDQATLSASGYNTSQVTVTVTASLSQLNTFNLTPAGKIYFLSNLSGKIDVVKTNLDGSGRQTVLAGTGSEDPNNTSLLATRDWSFLVLEAQRSGSQPALYLIDTSNDKVTQFDSGNEAYTLIGWYGHNFVYDAVQNNLQAWQVGREIIKSYNADNQTLNQLDQNQATGASGAYTAQSFNNFYILANSIVYTVQWSKYSGGDTSSDNDTIRAVQPGGQNKKDYKTWPANSLNYIQATLYQPQVVYYAVYDTSGNPTYYSFQNQSVSQSSSISQNDFNQPYPTYLVSPSGNQTFWSAQRDGKNSLFTGDINAQNSHQLASLSPYAAYGWYTDSYLLVSQSSSELYILPAGGLSGSQQPLKITDYYKPAINYSGYGYGYGGL